MGLPVGLNRSIFEGGNWGESPENQVPSGLLGERMVLGEPTTLGPLPPGPIRLPESPVRRSGCDLVGDHRAAVARDLHVPHQQPPEALCGERGGRPDTRTPKCMRNPPPKKKTQTADNKFPLPLKKGFMTSKGIMEIGGKAAGWFPASSWTRPHPRPAPGGRKGPDHHLRTCWVVMTGARE